MRWRKSSIHDRLLHVCFCAVALSEPVLPLSVGHLREDELTSWVFVTEVQIDLYDWSRNYLFEHFLRALCCLYDRGLVKFRQLKRSQQNRYTLQLFVSPALFRPGNNIRPPRWFDHERTAPSAGVNAPERTHLKPDRSDNILHMLDVKFQYFFLCVIKTLRPHVETCDCMKLHVWIWVGDLALK